MIQVFPITMTQIDWPTFLRETNNILRRNPNRFVDDSNEKGLGAFIGALGEMSWSPTTPSQARVDRPFLLEHANLGFLVIAPNRAIMEMIVVGNLSVAVAQEGNVAVVSGSIARWRDACIAGCKQHIDADARTAFNIVQSFIKQAGLADVFYNYRLVPLPDKTFILEQIQ